MSNTVQALAISGALVAFSAGGPLAQVFDETGLLMAIMGGLGGSLRFLALKGREAGIVARITQATTMTLLGAGFAFGVGVLAVPLVTGALGVDVSPDVPIVPRLLAAAAFLVGFAQERVIAAIMDRADRPGREGAEK